MQSVKKGVWCIGGKRKYRKRKQREKGFPIGLLASATVLILCAVAKPILKKKLVVEKEEEYERKNSASSTTCPSSSKSTQRYIFRVEVRKDK